MAPQLPWTPAGSEPCCCFECPVPAVKCETRSASKSKCGFATFTPTSPPKRYLRATVVFTKGTTLNSLSYAGYSGSDKVCENEINTTTSGSFTYVQDYDPATCGVSVTSCSGSIATTGEERSKTFYASGNVQFYKDDVINNGITYSLGTPCTETPFDTGSTTGEMFCLDGGACSPWTGSPVDFTCCTFCGDSTTTPGGTDDTETTRTVTTDAVSGTYRVCDTGEGDVCPAGCCGDVSGSSSGGGDTTVTTLSNEYTTSLLIANTEAALGSWPGTYLGTSCSAFRNLSTDESSYTIEDARQVIYIPAAMPAGKKLVVNYERLFTPEGGGTPTLTPGSVEIGPGATEAGPIEMPVPATDGEETFAIVSYECQDT